MKFLGVFNIINLSDYFCSISPIMLRSFGGVQERDEFDKKYGCFRGTIDTKEHYDSLKNWAIQFSIPF